MRGTELHVVARARTFALLVASLALLAFLGEVFFPHGLQGLSRFFTVFFPFGARQVDLRLLAKAFEKQHAALDRDDAPRALRHGQPHVIIVLVLETGAGALDILDETARRQDLEPGERNHALVGDRRFVIDGVKAAPFLQRLLEGCILNASRTWAGVLRRWATVGFRGC